MLRDENESRSGYVKTNKFFTETSLLAVFGAIVAYEVIRQVDLLGTHPYISTFTIAAIVAVVLLPIFIKNGRHRQVFALVSSHVLWLMLFGFYIPADSPFVLISFMLAYFAATLLEFKGLIFSLVVLIAAIEINTYRGLEDFANSVELLVPTLQAILLIGFGLLAAQVKKNQHTRQDKIEHSLDEARLAKQRLMSLVNSMADGVLATDEEGAIVLYNGAALETLNTNISLEGKSLSKFLPVVNKKGKPVDVLKKASRSNTVFTTRDLRLKIAKDEFINLYISVANVRLGYGQQGQKGNILVMRDITKEKSLEEERDEFISVVSHELRTPISTAEGNISNAQFMVEHKGGKKDVSDSLEQAHTHVVFLAELINDLSTLSRAERGVLVADPEKFSAKELADEVHSAYMEDAKAKSIDYLIKAPNEAIDIISSRLYVKEILQNFITNAVKYTPEKGVVTLEVSATSRGAKFTVTDSGIGISSSDKKRLFEKFFRSEDYRTRESNGTGLGLYVTQKLANIIHSTIEVDTKLNKGSSFSLNVPTMKLKARKLKK